MSFITKRERIFNTNFLYDLPSRNEGKLKAFTSCTDNRAWSHFPADQAEHLVEIVKRDNQICKKQCVPTEVIVTTLMGLKNSEIVRLKHKIGELEQMLAVYDFLDLTLEQKNEIAAAHETIKSAQKELDGMCLDLDLTNFTGLDSDSFRTGKSGGDASDRTQDTEISKLNRIEPLEQSVLDLHCWRWAFQNIYPREFGLHSPRWPDGLWPIPPIIDKYEYNTESKGNQVGYHDTCEIGTNITDSRIEELRDSIIDKDANLKAMRNTIAVMVSDEREPYCLYAHIYTALEKIICTLNQNEEYRKYLQLLSDSHQQVGNIDLKGKIIIKLKLLEKFSIALIAPCSNKSPQNLWQSSTTYYPVSSNINSTYAMTAAKTTLNNAENERDKLIVDIMNNDETKNAPSESLINNDDKKLEELSIDNSNLELINLNRLKSLQSNYNELFNCYESLREERDHLQNKCLNYSALEAEVDNLRHLVKNNKKEDIRKHSDDLNILKDQFIILSNESTALENQLVTESEINLVRLGQVSELTKENFELRQRIQDITIALEEDKNSLQCKLKEAECQILCQEEQIKIHINKLLQDNKPEKESPDQLLLLDQIKKINEDTNNLKRSYELEKEQLQEIISEKVKQINELQLKVEEGQSNDARNFMNIELLETHVFELNHEITRLMDVNKNLKLDVNEKTKAVENLMNTYNNKSEEIEKLLEENKQLIKLHNTLKQQLQNIQNGYNKRVSELETETNKTLQLVKQESKVLLNQFNELKISSSNISLDYEDLKSRLHSMLNENEELRNELKLSKVMENKLEILQNDYQSLLKSNEKLDIEMTSLKTKLDDEQKHSNTLKSQLSKTLLDYDIVVNELKSMKEKYSELKLTAESYSMSKKESEELFKKSEDKLSVFAESYQKSVLEKDNLLKSYNTLMAEKHSVLNELLLIQQEYKNLKIKYENNIDKTSSLQREFDMLQNENSKISNYLENKEPIENINKYEIENNKKKEYEKVTNINKLEIKEKNTTLNELKEEMTKENYNQELVSQHETLTNTLLNTKNQKDAIIINDLEEEIKQNTLKNKETAEGNKIELENLKKSNAIKDKINETQKKSLQENDIVISQLINEKYLILDNLKLLEIRSVGHSDMPPENCNTEDILQSFNRIKKSLDFSYSKSSLLEHKLLNVQTSSQVLQIKADEAKKIVETEKNKIYNEKEEAIQDRINMEKQLKQLKIIEDENMQDKFLIQELENELLNQRLLLQNINKTKDQDILKLKEEFNKLQDVYQNALKENNKNVIDLNNVKTLYNNNIIIMETTKLELKNKIDEVEILRQKLNSLHEQKLDIANNTVFKECEVQTEELHNFNIITAGNSLENVGEYINAIDQQNIHYAKELQVLATTTDPNSAFVENLYLSQKLKDLTCAPINVLSINDDIKRIPTSSVDIQKTLDAFGSSVDLINDFENSIGTSNQNFTENNNKLSPYTIADTTSNFNFDFGNETKLNIIMSQRDKPLTSDADTTNLSQKNKSRSLDNINNILDESSNNNISTLSLPNIRIAVDRNVQKQRNDLSVTTSKLKTSEFSKLTNPVNQEQLNNNKSDNIIQLIPASPTNINFKVTSTYKPLSAKDKYKNTINDTYADVQGPTTDTVKSETEYFHIYSDQSTKDSITESLASKSVEEGTSVLPDNSIKEYKSEIIRLSNELTIMKEEYGKKIDDIMVQYDNKIKILTDGQKDSSRLSKSVEKSISVKLDKPTEVYENEILRLSNELTTIKEEYSKNIEDLKLQYNNNIITLAKKHNESVQSIIANNEISLRDIKTTHDIEVDNLTETSISAVLKAEKSDIENRRLKYKLLELKNMDDRSSAKSSTRSTKKVKGKAITIDAKKLTKTNIQTVAVHEKARKQEPCKCPIDIGITDTIHKIFNEVDNKHRNNAERDYLKCIVEKLLKYNIDDLDTEELSFLYLNVARCWKIKLRKDQDLQDNTHQNFPNNHRSTQELLLNLNRLVEEENEILDMARAHLEQPRFEQPITTFCNETFICTCSMEPNDQLFGTKPSVEDLMKAATRPPEKGPYNHNRAIMAKLEPNRRREKSTTYYINDPPTKLQCNRIVKK